MSLQKLFYLKNIQINPRTCISSKFRLAIPSVTQTARKATNAQTAQTTDYVIGHDQLLENKNNNSKEWKSLTGNHVHPELDVTFENGKEAYKSKTTSDVFRAWLVFHLCSWDVLINNQKHVSLLIFALNVMYIYLYL